MRILVACEESQAVTKELRKLGHEAFSCDLLDCSGGKPEWHYQKDVFEVIEYGWDMMIAFPPCTFLSLSGIHWNSKYPERAKKTEDALDFVRKLMSVNIDKIVIENPMSVISSRIRSKDQEIQPWQFGDKATKTTWLWLKNVPKLRPTNIVEKGDFKDWCDSKTGKKKRQATWIYEAMNLAKTPEERRTLRSKTFPGIAKAMAEQFTKPLEQLKLELI